MYKRYYGGLPARNTTTSTVIDHHTVHGEYLTRDVRAQDCGALPLDADYAIPSTLAAKRTARRLTETVFPVTGVSPSQVIVGVPALNEADHIETCLISLVEGDPFMSEVRIVVADGGSTDATREIVRRLSKRLPNLRLIDNPKRLQAAAMNAVAETEAEQQHLYLVRCDAHAAYPPGYVRKVAESLASRPEAAAVGTVMDAKGTSRLQRAAAWVVDTPFGSGGSAHRGGTRSGWVDHAHHAGMRLDWFKRVGGYDETFTHNEDAELDHRLCQAGGRIWLDSTIRLDYRMRDSLRGLWLQYWRYGCGRARNLMKHRMRPRLRQILPVAAVLGIAFSLGVGLVWPPAFVLALSYAAVACGVSLVGAVALGRPWGLLAGPAMAAMHMAWGMGFLRQLLAGMERT